MKKYPNASRFLVVKVVDRVPELEVSLISLATEYCAVTLINLSKWLTKLSVFLVFSMFCVNEFKGIIT